MTSPTVQRRRRRRVLALATAGLALCIGVSVTSLAAWQQQVTIATGADGIGSSLLKLEISLDGTNWSTATVNSNGNLSFTGNAALLTPGDTVYAGLLIRAAKGSRGADVTLKGGAVADALVNVLTYGAKSGVAWGNCTGTAWPSVGDTIVGLGSALTPGTGGTAFRVPAGTSNAAGTPVGVCLAITLPLGVPNVVGGLTTTPAWQFDATSV